MATEAPWLLQIYLAVDRDKAGETLAAELSRRLGRQKCKLTQWPANWIAHSVHLGAEEAMRRMQQFEDVRTLPTEGASCWPQ